MELDFGLPTYAPIPDGIDLRLSDVRSVIAEVGDVSIVHADPPWSYDVKNRNGGANKHYPLCDEQEIATHLDAAYDATLADAYLLCWSTWPKLGKWFDAARGMRWQYLSGGSWHKTGSIGIGFHWRGDSEPLLLYRKGRPKPVGMVSNSWASHRQGHSAKPIGFISDVLAALAPSNALVLDLYAGTGTAAIACLKNGQRYVGAEIDPERYAAARMNIMSHHSEMMRKTTQQGELF